MIKLADANWSGMGRLFDHVCIRCGRPCKSGSLILRLIRQPDGIYAIHHYEAGPAGIPDLGSVPIGDSCLREHPELIPYCLWWGETDESHQPGELIHVTNFARAHEHICNDGIDLEIIYHYGALIVARNIRQEVCSSDDHQRLLPFLFGNLYCSLPPSSIEEYHDDRYCGRTYFSRLNPVERNHYRLAVAAEAEHLRRQSAILKTCYLRGDFSTRHLIEYREFPEVLLAHVAAGGADYGHNPQRWWEVVQHTLFSTRDGH